MEFITDYVLEDYILNTTWDDLPDAVQNRAIVCAVDLFSALILGSRGKQRNVGIALAEGLCQKGSLPVIGTGKTFSLLGATIVTGHMANSFDIDDGHNGIKGHPGASFVAGLLAASLEKGISYREFLTTLAVTYEVTIRCARAQQGHYNYLHSTGAYGAFGTAAGMGRILGLSKEQLNTALSIADFHAPMTPVMRSVTYPSMNKDGVPFGSLIGAMAVMETMAGSTGRGYLLEMPEHRSLSASLGATHEILNLYFKPYTCCRWAHQPIHACLGLIRKHGIAPEDIESVTIHTFDAAAKLSRKIPENTDEAQYNIAYPVAAAIIHGNVGLEQVNDDAIGDTQVIDMMSKLRFVVDPELERQFPAKRIARVTMELSNGRMVSSDNTEALGEAGDNVDLDWIEKKFARITCSILDSAQQGLILSHLRVCDSTPITRLVSIINAAL